MFVMPEAPSLSMARQKILVITVVGVAAGFLSGVFGVGGGILIAPGLVFLAKMDHRRAYGTSLAAVLPIALSSMITYWAQGHIDWPVMVCLTTGAIVGALIGTYFLNVVSQSALAFGFSAILVLSAVRLFFEGEGDSRSPLTFWGIVLLVVIGLISGILAGLLGVGGGIIMVPAMLVFFSIPSIVAKGTSLAVIVPTALMGTIRNRSNKNVDIPAAVIIGLSGIAAAVAGAWFSTRLSDTTSNVLFACLMLAVASKLLWQERGRFSTRTK
jgi:uncharacterized membrane protein YfcA